jgi:cysteine desulfurase
MNRIYLDNAATTAVEPLVVEAMLPYLSEKFGNPSSIYSYGREVRAGIEAARKSIAALLGAHPGELFFTSGGTESANMVMRRCVNDLGVKHIITSPIEHHCVLHTAEDIAHLGRIQLHIVKLLPDGMVDLTDLENLLVQLKSEPTLVSLMHANNEIGNLLDLMEVGNLVKKHGAYFHSDTVQTVAHYRFNLHQMPIDFITGSGHKFHGPKGIGMVYISERLRIKPFIAGGGQERNMRAGTENVTGIIGFTKALELAYANFDAEKEHIESIKDYMKAQLIATQPDIKFNGNQTGQALYTVLSCAFPKTPKSEMILYALDMAGVCVSGGSACSSGADAGSHVIKALKQGNADQSTVRFSFSKYTTKEEVDTVINLLKTMI